MKILDVTPMLTVTDLDASLKFYGDVLGFRCVARMEGWACVEHSGTEIMLALPNAHVPFVKPEFTGSLYFNTDDVDGWWSSLKERCVVEYPLEDFNYGMREFAVRDNFGYLLQFGGRIV